MNAQQKRATMEIVKNWKAEGGTYRELLEYINTWLFRALKDKQFETLLPILTNKQLETLLPILVELCKENKAGNNLVSEALPE